MILSHKNPYACSIGIANELVFPKSNVSMTTRNLRENGYILMDDQGHVILSSMRKETAETMYERHTMLSQQLIYLGMDEQAVAEDACHIERVVSTEGLRAARDHITKGHESPEDNL